MANILVLCTGNAARSVMAGAAIEQRSSGHVVTTAGTLAVEGMPMSWRTKTALKAIDLQVPEHRSKQATAAHLDQADVIVGLAPEHVAWVRRNHPHVVARTITLIRLARQLQHPSTALHLQLGAMNLTSVELEAWEEVVDPGGGEVDVFVNCAGDISNLVNELLTRLPID